MICKQFLIRLVFQIGDHATTLYIILSGMVKVKSRETFGEPTKTTNTLMAGQSFGELALVKDTQRTTTVATTTFTELLAIHKEDYEVLKMTYEKDTDEKIEVLNKIEVFKTWPRSDLSRLANLMLFQKFPPNKGIIPGHMLITFSDFETRRTSTRNLLYQKWQV